MNRSAGTPWSGPMTTTAPRVAIVGGPDVDARIELMRSLRGEFELCALGSAPELGPRFAAAGFGYRSYQLGARANPLADLRGLGQLVALLRQLRPQIVHAFATRPCVWGRLAARIAGVPVVLGTLPGLGSLYASESLRVRAIRQIYGPLQALACRNSDRTIFQNGDDMKQFVAAGMLRAEDAIIVPGSGVPTELFAPERVSAAQIAALRAELGVGADDILVVMIGRVIRSKGVLEYMQAARLLGASHPKLRFLLVGAEVDSSVDRLNQAELAALRQSLIWTGTRGDIPIVLAAADICTLPSTYREGIPRVLLEAAAMGLPIVTSDAPGCREVVVPDLNGMLVPPGDAVALAAAIATLAEDPALRQRYGQAARRRAVERFDLRVVARQTAALYHELLTEKGYGAQHAQVGDAT